MLDTFLATLNPMLTLFICIAVGYIANKTKILPENAGKVMAKLETWIFCPALSFSTMAKNCRPETLSTHAKNILLSCILVTFSLTISTLLARFFVKEKSAERGVYLYALAFANSGYIGDPLVLALFGDVALSYYKLFCLPISITIYTWGISVLVPAGENKSNSFKRLLTAPTVAMLLGIAAGLTGLGAIMPTPIISALDSLKACMGPVAMLLAGFTVARFDLVGMLKNKKVYAASVLRLTVIPAVIISALFGIKTLLNLAFGMGIGNSVLFLAFFAIAAPLGLNTVVFPEAYGGDPKTGASMTLISHTLCILTIPILYALMIELFGAFTI
ncbi:MAG: AEC family transporter [Clostridia bacterium]|nr:AEC family transporter [Clostridia bacterium]